MGQRQNNNYLGGDSSQEAFISLPLIRAISSGIIQSKKPTPSRRIIQPLEQLASSEVFKRFTAGLAVFTLAFLCAFLTANIATPPQNSNAETVTATVDDTGYYLNIYPHDVDLSLVATPTGSTVVEKDTITTETNSPTGFKLYISTNSTTSTSNRLTHENGTNYIPAVSGTNTSPTKLANNTWGYALTSTPGNEDGVTGSSYFIGVPLLNNEYLIKEYTSPATTGNGVTTDVYFGVRATTGSAAGTYTSTVKYTALAEAYPAYDNEVAVSPETSVLAGGGTLTISTGLYTNANDLGTVTVTVGGSSCTDVTRVANANSDLVTLTCTLPAFPNGGWKDVVVSIPKFEKTYSLSEAIVYAPTTLAELKGLSLEYRYMQYMTKDICNEMTEATSSNYSSVQLQLTDSRDGNSYITRKLKDGNCWMTENLRLTFQNGYAVNVDDGSLTTLTSHNTDFTTLESWSGLGQGGQDHTTETSPTVSGWGDDRNNPNNLAKSYSFENDTYTDGSGDTHLKGALYNWYTATAGRGIDTTTSSDTIDDSICPQGWRLPASSSVDSKGWMNLLRDVSYADVFRHPYDLANIGVFVQEWVTRTDLGVWWTREASEDGDAVAGLRLYELREVFTIYSDNKGLGFSIRCVNR